ncbi:MAG: hypothetical protein NTX65_12515 [Ignavibacteriales bacterium]|nr:hypothetical protein [Ignavibacteriales bacterium]
MNKGSFLDNRDGRRYKWIRIGNQIIMAENFAYKPDNGKYWAYEDSYTLSEDTVAKFGYLYDWETANKVAPDGWHLPTKEEWLALFSDFKKFLYKEFYVEWKYLPEKEDGTKYTLFGGMYNHRNGCCSYGNGQSFFWSSTEVDGELAFGLYIPERTSEDIPGIKYNRRGDGLSVILFQD